MALIEFKCAGCGKLVTVDYTKYSKKLMCADCKPVLKTSSMRIP